MGHDEITSALGAVITWLVVGGIKRWAPDMWQSVDSQKLRLFVVAFVAMGVAAGTALMSGAGLSEAFRLALAAFSGAVVMRQATKPRSTRLLPYSDAASIETKSPDPRGNTHRF